MSTFRLRSQHREGLAEYAMRLGLLMEPKKQVSKNEALLHMIEHSSLILKSLRSESKRQSEAPPPPAG